MFARMLSSDVPTLASFVSPSWTNESAGAGRDNTQWSVLTNQEPGAGVNNGEGAANESKIWSCDSIFLPHWA